MKILVNVITTFRFLYTMILPILKGRISRLAFIINITLLFLTDSIDGALARKFKVQTLYGSVMDTIADKTLSIILIVLLIKKIEIVNLMLIGEVIIACINTYSLLRGKKTKSSIIGKLKMWFISIAIILGYMYYFNMIGYTIALVFTILTIILQITAIVDYVFTLSKQQPPQKQFEKKEKYSLREILFSTEYYLTQYKI